jgi:hypothetical protein
MAGVMDDTQSKERCSKLRSIRTPCRKGGRARRPFSSGRGQRPIARGPALSNEATAATGSNLRWRPCRSSATTPWRRWARAGVMQLRRGYSGRSWEQGWPVSAGLRSGAGNRGCQDHEDQKVHASFSGQGRLARLCHNIQLSERIFVPDRIGSCRNPALRRDQNGFASASQDFQSFQRALSRELRHDLVVACRHVQDAFTACRPIDAEQFRQGDGEPFADAWFYCGQSPLKRMITLSWPVR